MTICKKYSLNMAHMVHGTWQHGKLIALTICQSISKPIKAGVKGKASDSRVVDIGCSMPQCDCLIPVLFICTLHSVFRGVNKKKMASLQQLGTAVQDLRHTNSIGLIDKDAANASDRAECLCTHSTARLEMNIPKTKANTICLEKCVSTTTEEDIAKMSFQHRCDTCGHTFPTFRGERIHKGMQMEH